MQAKNFDNLTLSKIQFSSAIEVLSQNRTGSKQYFLNTNKSADIDLNGFTSSEGEANFKSQIILKKNKVK